MSDSIYFREMRLTYKRAKVCVTCRKNDADPWRTRCQSCAERHNARPSARGPNTGTRRRAGYRDSGPLRCGWCREPGHYSTTCPKLIRAAAATTEPATTNNLAFAILETGIALLELAKVDDTEEAGQLVHDVLVAERDRRREEAPNGT